MDNVEKMEKSIKGIKTKVRKTYKSWRLRLILIGVLLAIILSLFILYVTNLWFNEHTFVFKAPVLIKVQQPIAIEKRFIEPVTDPLKQPTAKELIASEVVRKQKEREAFIERLYQATRFLESRVGFDTGDSTATHTYCQSIGKVNEVGYFPEGNRHFCFDDEAEQRLTLTRWFSKKLDGMTVQEALCLYVTGTRQPTCSRVMNVGL